MTDEQIEELIFCELRKRDVTIFDMTGLPNHGVDPNPEDETTERNQRIRTNRFRDIMASDRMKELLCAGEYNPYHWYPILKISLQDLFRFWWNRCVEKEAVVDEILEDIFTYFTEKMRPPEKKKKQMDLTVDFDRLPLFAKDMDKAA